MNFGILAKWSLAAIVVATTVQTVDAQQSVVNVRVRNGELQVTGSNFDDEVRLTPRRRGGTVRVQGLGGTRISLNGRSPRSAVNVRRVNSLDARMGRGDDFLAIDGLNLNEAAVDMSDGNDSAVIQDSGFEILSYAGGSGADSLDIGEVSSGLTILSGGANVDALVDLGDNDLGALEVDGFEENGFGVDEAPEQPAPEQPAPEQPAPEQPAPEQPAPEDPAPEAPEPEVVINSLSGPETIRLATAVSELVRYDSIDDAPATNDSFTIGVTERLFEFSNGSPGLPADVIDLSAIDANINTARNDAFVFIGDAEFSGTPGELRARFRPQRGGFIPAASFVTGDVDGDGQEDFTILLINDGVGALRAPLTLINFRL